MDKVVKALEVVIEEIQSMPEAAAPRETGREEFALLLSGIATCRKAPGIPVHMGYESLYRCEGTKAEEALKAHLFRLYNIHNKASLKEACMERFTTGREYEQFMTFWCGAPLFDPDELADEGRQVFETRMELASMFYPYLRERGFYAWDINERIGLGRKAYACGLITEEEFYGMFDSQIRKAQVFYHSFKEYAMSCLCGALYFVPESIEEDMLSFLDINVNLLRSLLGEGGAWYRNSWYVPDEREWVHLLPHNGGCIVSRQIAEGRSIGYMYRDEESPGLGKTEEGEDTGGKWADTGWRFFAGDESDEYINHADNAAIWSLNTVCNIDPTILGYVEAKGGSAFGRDENGEWVRNR